MRTDQSENERGNQRGQTSPLRGTLSRCFTSEKPAEATPFECDGWLGVPIVDRRTRRARVAQGSRQLSNQLLSVTARQKLPMTVIAAATKQA
jgi:hypothetical protein